MIINPYYIELICEPLVLLSNRNTQYVFIYPNMYKIINCMYHMFR